MHFKLDSKTNLIISCFPFECELPGLGYTFPFFFPALQGCSARYVIATAVII